MPSVELRLVETRRVEATVKSRYAVYLQLWEESKNRADWDCEFDSATKLREFLDEFEACIVQAKANLDALGAK